MSSRERFCDGGFEVVQGGVGCSKGVALLVAAIFLEY